MNPFKRESEAEAGPVVYFDDRGLRRPLDMPLPALIIMGAFVVAAIIIGVWLGYRAITTVSGNAASSQASVEENLARPVTLDLPQITSLFFMDDATIKQTLADSGAQTYDLSSTGDAAANGIDLFKLPSDVSLIDATALYAKGISNLSASNAALILNGSWRLTVDRGDYTDLRVKYADFKSGSVEAAIQSAMVAEGLSTTTLGASGTDDSGNTYQSGNIDIDGTTYTWRVSACSLSNIYNISGLPSNAVYVGIRMTP